MFILKILSFFFVCIFAVCSNSKVQIENNSQTRQTAKPELSLTMERSRCYGTCPAYKIDVQSDGKILFEGIDFTKVKGKAASNLSEEKTKQLIAEINKADFFSLKDAYTEASGNCPTYSTDSPTVKISVKLNDQEKIITHYLGCGGNDDTKKLFDLENIIDEIVETKRWIGEKY